MRIAIYGRVSTSHQVEHQTIEQQLGRLTAHVGAQAAEGWALDPAHVFRDDGYSGAALVRPGLDRLRDAIKGCEVDRVLVTAPDRLARNYVHQMVLLEEWTRAGCAAEFLDRPMSDDPHDHLLLQIRGAVAEYERTLIAERMRRGRLAKLRAGTMLPWTYAPYGYRLSPDRPRDPSGVTIDQAEAAVVAELFAMYREPGTSLMQLALRLDARGVPTARGRPRWSSPTIRGILRNPTYTGQVHAQRTQYRAATHRRSATHPIGRPHGSAVPQPADTWLLVGQVPAMVSQAHFDEVQAKLATNQSFARRNNTAHQYLLRALVSCGRCGLACTARATNGRNFYYLCSGKGHSTFSHRATCCPARHTPAGQLDALVWDDLCALLAEPEPLATAVARAHGGAWLPQELLARRETLRRGQAHLRQQLERLTDAYLRAVIPLDEYERRRRDLEQRVQALAGQEEQLRSDAARQQQLAGIAASLEAFRGRVQSGLAQASFEQRRQLVLLLIDRVVVTDADVEIRYVLPTSPDSEHVRFCHLRKDYFDHPATRQGDKALCSPGTADDEQREAEQEAGQDCWHAVVAAVGEHGAQPAIQRLDASEQPACAVRVLDGGGMDDDAQQQPLRVHGDVSLAPCHLLGRIKAAGTAAFRGLHALAVDHRGRRAWLPARALAQHDHEVMTHGLPHARVQEGAEVAIHRRPRQERGRRRQVPPLAAGAQHVEQAIQHAPHVRRARAPSGLGRRDQGPQQPPLVVRQRLARPIVSDQRAILGCPHGTLHNKQTTWNAATTVPVTPSNLAHNPFQNGLLAAARLHAPPYKGFSLG
jgi:site-specific DNA recombinase